MIDVLTEMEPAKESDEEIMTALEGCLAKLPATQRELISARYTAGRSLEQQAKQMGRSPSNLRVALHRIRAGLKECIELTLSGKTA
jgi:RNA polymerase sigma-70 factor (ECF subfamily)